MMHIKYISFLISLIFFSKAHADTITLDVPEVSSNKATSVSVPHRNTVSPRSGHNEEKSITKSKAKAKKITVSSNKIGNVSVSHRNKKSSSSRVKPRLGRNEEINLAKPKEEILWNSVKKCNKANKIKCYKTYLSRFPKGKHAVFARQKTVPFIINKPFIKPIKDGNYIDNGNVVIKHAWSKLTWKKCSQGQDLVNNKCRGTADLYRWKDAQREVNTNWRLPTIMELKTLVYCSNGVSQEEAEEEECKGKKNKTFTRPAINSLFTNTSHDALTWSSDSYDLDNIMVLNFGLGYADTFRNDGLAQVRLVRR